MKRNNLFYLIIFCSIIFSCSSESDKSDGNTLKIKEKKIVNHDLDEVLAEGVLNVSTTYSATSYFLYKGQTMGFEYEILQRFAEHLGVKLNMKIETNINNLITNLNEGEVDLMAFGLTVTNQRKKEISFSSFVYQTHQVLVQKKPDNWRKLNWSKIEKSLIHDAIELIDDTVSVRYKTAYYARLKNMEEEMGGVIYIDTVDGKIPTDEIISMVAEGKLKYTIADDNIARLLSSNYPILDIDVPISLSQNAAWATRHSSPKLLEALNEWLIAFKKETTYYVIYNKYFKNKRNFKKRIKSDFYSLNTNTISQYDELIKKRAEMLDWDWRLLASLIYQESRFDPRAKSWAGAGGLMQVMPATAKELGIKDRSNPAQSVIGGTKYLQQLWQRFDSISDDTQRIKFVMASYNCGHGHVLDAQRLATKNGLDKFIWDDNVEQMILDLSHKKYYTDPLVRHGYVRGAEPYHYVQQIFERYKHYKDFIKK